MQPISSATPSGRSPSIRKLGTTAKRNVTTAGNLGLSSMTIHNWDGAAIQLGQAELHNAAIALAVCKQDNAPAKAVLALIEALIVENGVHKSPGTTDHTSTGILQLLPSTASSFGINPLDVADVCHAFLTRGYHGKGGAITLSRSMSAGQMATSMPRVSVPVAL